MIYLVGMGPGHPKYVTREAVEILAAVESKIAFGRIAETAGHFAENVRAIKKLEEILLKLNENQDSAILASGDACFYGILDFLKNKQVKIDYIVPGLTSFQYMMSRLQMSWHDASFFSLHGRLQAYGQMLDSRLSVILTDKNNPPSEISRRLYKLGGRGSIYAGFDLSYESEMIIRDSIGSQIPDKSSLSTVIVEIEKQEPVE